MANHRVLEVGFRSDLHSKPPSRFDIRAVRPSDIKDMCRRFHAYASSGNSCTYAFGVFEQDLLVAAYSWQPPPNWVFPERMSRSTTRCAVPL